MGIVLNNRRLAILVVALVLLGAFGAWFLHPGNMLNRAWNSLIAAVESRKAAVVRGHLAADYSDAWGYTRDSIAIDARFAFQHFQSLEVQVRQLQIARSGDQAIITALIQLEAEGTAEAANARARVNGLFTPFSLEWRRESSFPWAWKLIRISHPELDLRRVGVAGY